MNTDGRGKIDKYNMAVFFLKLADFEELIVPVHIEEEMGFVPQYLFKKITIGR